MKRFLTILVVTIMILSMTACSTTTPTVSSPEGSEASIEPSSEVSTTTSPEVSNAEVKAPDDYPSKPITIIAPANPGGGYDSLSRAVASMAGQYLGQVVIVKNVPGASFTLGASEALHSAADGYTFVLCTNKQFSTTPYAVEVDYDPINDVQCFASMAEVRWIWSVNGGLYSRIGVSDTAGFLEYVKGNPGVIRGGVISTTTSLMFNLLAKAGYEFSLTSYADAASLAVAIANGEVDCGFSTPSAVQALQASGDIQFAMEIPGITGEKFMEGVPSAVDDFPEILEILGASSDEWYGLFGPVGIPQDVIEQVNEFIYNITQDDGFTSLVKKIGVVPAYHTAEEMKATIAEEYAEVGEFFASLSN